MKLYNTLSGTTETFSPLGDTVSMYVCGITPYSSSHVGHAMRAVVFDVIRRYLEFQGHRVKHVENFTDIDDKMIQGAAAEGVSTQDLAEKHIEAYLRQMDALNVKRAHYYPRATLEIPKIQQMIEALVASGAAYAVNGDVYFRVRRDPEYGKLGRRDLDTMRAGARVEIDERKEDVMDFALWKGHKAGEPAWGSPWGPGRPGWHIECSAMAWAYLGDTLDIHGGGQDLVFPHHENEIAQSEAYTGQRPMARWWVHNGLMRLGDDPMSKSMGNLVTVGEALDHFSSDALRLFFLGSHYRGPMTYTEEGAAAQERAVERLRHAASEPEASGAGEPLDPEPFRRRFTEAMDDDLNTPRAIAALFDLARDINRAREGGDDVGPAARTLRELAGVLGLTLEERGAEAGADVGPLMALLIEARTNMRAAKLYEQADQVRDRLADMGYQLEDTPAGTEWERRGS